MGQQQESQGTATPTMERVLAASWRHRHILDLDDMSPEDVETVFRTTDAMVEILSREVKRVPTLRGKTVVTLFYEPSTRTRASFEIAAKNLSADVVSFSGKGTSVEKGESFLDTLLTVQSLGADVIVIRHGQSGAPYVAARQINASVVNGGDGWHAHPSQALLDLYTIRHHKSDINGLKVVILGDILHSRVARSNIWGLTCMGAKVVLCGPPTLLPSTHRHTSINPVQNGYTPHVDIETDIRRALEGADVIMPLRLQLERQQSGLLPTIREYIHLYQLNETRLRLAREDAIVLHPGPMNEGIEISAGVAHGRQSVIEEQVSNGVAVRMALLYLVIGGGKG